MFRSAPVALLTVAVAVSGCATSYTPRPGPRLSVVLQDGKPAYVRDGKTFEAGMFGDGLIDAVEGVPEAEEHARTFRNRNVSGFATTLAGTGLMVGGMIVGVHGLDSHRADRQQLALGMLLGGLIVEVIGSVLVASAPSHQLDAINIYNDAVEERTRTFSPNEGEDSRDLQVDKTTRRRSLAATSASREGQHPPALPVFRF